MLKYLKILNKFYIVFILVSSLNALSLEEMLQQDNIKPSFDCDLPKLSESEMDICGGVGMIPASYFAIIDNFYSSYYKAVIKHIDLKDKTIIKNISLTMLKERGKVCPNTKFDDNVSSGLNSALAAQCYYYPYNKALREITEFIYNNPKYKNIFEQIFYPNPKGYYQLIMNKKPLNPDSPFDDDAEVIFDVIDKAAKDNLLKSNGALKKHE